MKKQTVNVFSEGLNYDFHPMTTPNNVLTDVVNGTFLTFNGNELSLQNDAGNIVINIKNANDNIPEYDKNIIYNKGDFAAISAHGRARYYICLLDNTLNIEPADESPNWAEYVVRLTDGFYPIGVKEKGGVLYIVSRKQQGGEPNDEVDEIEFGSFPSPELFTYKTGASADLEIEMVDNPETPEDDTNIPNILYKPIVLNNIIFKPGEYISFSPEAGENLAYLTTYSAIQTAVKFYKLKLYQQLTSGYIDLTKDIDEAFKTYGSSKTHWLLDNTFKYYCPYLYKGKLSVELIMEPITVFEISKAPTLDINTSGFIIEFKVKMMDEFMPYHMVIRDIEVNADIGGVEISTITTGSLIDHEQLVTITVPIEYIDETVNFTVVPKYSYFDNSSTHQIPLIDIPNNYQEKYKLIGQVLLNQSYKVVQFPFDTFYKNSLNNTCGNDGIKVYKELPLANGDGQPLDPDLEVFDELSGYGTSKYYVLLHEETPPLLPMYEGIKLGTFKFTDGDMGDKVDPDSVIFTEPVTPTNQVIIKNATTNLVVKQSNDNCLRVDLTIHISGESLSTVKMSQPDIGNSAEVADVNSTTFSIAPNVATIITIIPNNESYREIKDYVSIGDATSYNYILLGKLELAHMSENQNIVRWNNSLNLNNPDITVTYFDNTGTVEYPSQLRLDTTNVLWDENIHAPKYLNDDTFINSYEFTGTGNTLTITYKNTPVLGNFVVFNNIVFAKSGGVETIT